MSRNFERLEVWKKSCRLCVHIFRAMKMCKEYGLRDQITRSAVSIPSNIAEGAERPTQKEYLRFIDIAKGSAGELRTQLYILLQLYPAAKEDIKTFIREAKEISRMLQSLQNTINQKSED